MMEVRELRIEDKPDIIEICKTVYAGNDFVPNKMAHWIEGRAKGKHYPFAVLVDGRVAAVTNIKVMDKGVTAWIEGLRVHPDFRGKGVATFVNKWTMQHAKELGLKRGRYTTDSSNTPATNLAKATGLSIVSTMVLFYLPAPFDQYKFPTSIDGAQVPPPISLQKIDVPAFLTLVKSLTEEERRILIPLDSVLIEWTTFDVFDLEQVAKDITFEIYVHTGQNGKLESFTLYADMTVMAGVKAVPSVYCKNFEELVFHINHFHQRAVQEEKTLFDLKICVNEVLTFPLLSEFYGSLPTRQVYLWELVL